MAIAGSGYAPGESIDIQLQSSAGDGGIHLATATADDKGTVYIAGVRIPADTPAGNYQIAAAGLSSARMAKAGVHIAQITATLSVSSTTFAPADTVQVSGTSFVPREQITIALISTSGAASVVLGQVQADDHGTFGPTTVRVPFGAPAGQAQIVATGLRSNRQAILAVTLKSALPFLAISATSALPGDVIAATGAHFQPGEALTVELVTLSGSIPLATGRANTAGSFSISGIGLPTDAPQGNQNVVVTGTSSHLSAETAIAIGALHSGVEVTGKAVPGNTLSLSGDGFIPAETLTLELSGGSLPALSLGTAVADGNGTFSGLKLVLPGIVSGGSYTLSVTGLTSGRVATKMLTVHAPKATGPLLGVVPPSQTSNAAYTANPGALVQVAGTHFAPGVPVTLALVSAPTTTADVLVSGRSVAAGAASARSYTLTTVRANANGSIGPLGVALPVELPTGSYTVQASAAGHVAASTTLQVRTIKPLLRISASTLSPGGAATLRGAHFAAGEQVVIALNGAAIATKPSTVLADRQGGFVARFVAPAALLTGANTLTANGAASRAAASVHVGARVAAASRWYFANGNTMTGYRTTISLLNPANVPARVQMTFLYQAAPARAFLEVVPPHAHAVVDLALAAGAGRHVSTILEADHKIGAETTIYYGAHVVTTTLGAAAPATSWYLAEGYTGQSFREFLVIMNPNPSYAAVDLRFLPFNGQPPRDVRFVIGARATILVDAGHYMPLKSISAIVTADKGIVVERAMRFGLGRNGAHGTIGSTTAATVWMFAQGESAPNRQTFLTVLNPSPASPAAVTASFFDRTGRPLGTTTIVINPLRRGNIKLNDVLVQAQVATVLTSNVPVVVERSQYAGPANLDLAHSGSVVLGRNGAGNTWLFPGASTAHGEQAQIYLFNPGTSATHASATFYTDRGAMLHQRVIIPANGYTVINVNAVAGLPAGEVGAMLTGDGNQLFIAEQSQYNSAAQSISATQGLP